MNPVMITFIMLALSISLQSQAQKIPAAWSRPMKLEAHYGGGMMYYSYDILITDTSSYMKVLSNKGAKKYTRKFTQQELNSILAFLQTHRFGEIKSEDVGPTKDKASKSITLSWDSNMISASENAMSSITDEYKGDFNDIQAYLEQLFHKDK